MPAHGMDNAELMLSELIATLERLKAAYGDMPVKWHSLTHSWNPDPVVRRSDGRSYVLLNP